MLGTGLKTQVWQAMKSGELIVVSDKPAATTVERWEIIVFF